MKKFSCVALTFEPRMNTAVFMNYRVVIHEELTELSFLMNGMACLFPPGCFTGRGSTPLLVPGAAAQRWLPGGRRGGKLAERTRARSNQTPQSANTQQAACTQTLAHHTAAHPGQTEHPLTSCLSALSFALSLSSYHTNIIWYCWLLSVSENSLTHSPLPVKIGTE